MTPAGSLRLAIESRTLPVVFAGVESAQHPLPQAFAAVGFQTRIVADLEPAATFGTRHSNSGPEIIVIHAAVGLSPAGGVDIQRLHRGATQLAVSGHARQLILLHGLVPPGTTRSLVPILAGGRPTAELPGFLACATDVLPGSRSRLVGGLDPTSQELAVALLRQLPEPVQPVSTLETCELGGLLPYAVLTTQAALGQELRLLCDKLGVPFWEVLEAAGQRELIPSSRAGGSAPALLSWAARRCGATMRLLDTAGQINAAIPTFLGAKIEHTLNTLGKPLRGSRVRVLSSALDGPTHLKDLNLRTQLISLLHQKGVIVHEEQGVAAPDRGQCPSPTAPVCGSQDLVVVLSLPDGCDPEFLVASSSLVLDTCHAMAGVTSHYDRIVFV